MMRELQKCCDAYEGPELESVGEGKLYAGKCMDNYWYRCVRDWQLVKRDEVVVQQ